MLATLVRQCGSWQLAEDALQDATERALVVWRRDGVPPEPRAWLTLAARRRVVDVLRREAARDVKEAGAVTAYPSATSGDDDAIGRLERLVSGGWPEEAEDDQLSLVFACCHPSLARETQLALALRFLCGLSTPEVARALLVPEATLSKRLTRAKDKMARAHVPFRVPPLSDLPERVAGVAGVVALLFNEGYASVGGDPRGRGGAIQRPDLTAEAIRLARLLRSLMPDDATVAGLLALLLLQDSRRAARVDAAGEPVLLRDQDRSRWDRDQVAEGVLLVAEGLRRTRETPDRFVVQAALAACHAIAPSWVATDWDALLSWYDVLLTVEDTPVVRLNRAVALAERDGADAGLAELARLEGTSGWDGHVWFHASRAELLARVGRLPEADRAFADALGLPLADGWRRRLERRRAEVAAGRP